MSVIDDRKTDHAMEKCVAIGEVAYSYYYYYYYYKY